MFRAASSVTTIAPKHSNKEMSKDILQQINELNLPLAFSSSELLKMLEDQKKEIEELQGSAPVEDGQPSLSMPH